MSIQDPPLPIAASPPDERQAASLARPSFWDRLVGFIERAGEWLNPLLVKECRQALKSRQFSMTFTLVLCLAWVWSIAGIARLGAEVFYSASGPELFYGYYGILAFPLLLIVPFSAFRSLIAEHEDNTFEVVAITTLRPRQIVGGKLGSAVAQMLVYFSAIAPCLAFTYLLRGIDILTIILVLVYTFMASVGFSLAALLLATIAKEKHWQVMMSVLLVVGLFSAFTAAMELCHDIFRSSRPPYHDREFWQVHLFLLTVYASTFAMLYLAAAAQLTFTAENRSTPLRITMLAQQALVAGWAGYSAFYMLSQERGFHFRIAVIAETVFVLSAIYWLVMGSFMIGETPELSPRVKRGLPKTGLGRLFLTWFNPGPGTGYMFAVSNAMAAGVLAATAVWYGDGFRAAAPVGVPSLEAMLMFIVMVLGYLIIYLGLGHLLLRFLRRFTQVTLASSVLMNALLLMIGWGVPWVIHEMSNVRTRSYTLLHVTDPFWSCAEVVESTTSSIERDILVWIIPLTAVGIFLWNLAYILPEIRHVRITPPPRVDEESQELAKSPEPSPTNPWD